MSKREISIGFAALGLALSATYAGSAQTSTPSGQDASFVQTVQTGNDEEIADARYMLQHTQNTQVRSFANEMISDHSSANVALLKAARNAGVPVPQGMRVADRAAAPAMLRGLAGMTLVQTYEQSEIAGHKKMLDTLKSEENSTGNPALVAYASSQEPIVQHHYDQVSNLASGATSATPQPATEVTPPASSPGPNGNAPSIAPSTAPLPPQTNTVPTNPPGPVASGAPPTHSP